jgi:hypothetical protein
MRYLGLGLSLVISLMSFSSSAAGTDSAERTGVYTYLGFGHVSPMQIRDHGTVMVGDYGTLAKICGEESEYYCVKADFFHFAVPKKLTADKPSWVVDDRTYKLIVPARSMSILGTTYSVAVISNTITTSGGSTVTTFYYYSPAKGLLAFEESEVYKPGDTSKLPPGDFPSLNILAGDKGFGAVGT